MLLITRPSLIVVALACLWLAGCANHPQQSSSTPENQHAIKFALYSQYDEWQGVPYRMGGLSKTGVDCSGLVYLTFRDQFNLHLPRNTQELAKAGATVKPENRRSGDLVLFRINSKLNHIGIYLEDNRFMHTSAQKGVMISDLNHPYWQKRYWKTVRPRHSLLAAND
jgi:cell wall-associated NlpC family hydrolase